ncbi:hypothetical protein [Spirosoma montaniterrae]|uniref:Uncharacterized protein n=1 Tax=Spirosoma montaniterrae TaxID=1178516 RepID=A0A1P9WSK7_9BACT|nr:hypothetical protein [Spirosoma montaniterrae]AQG78339.1 hypothetical protein AWR27_02685 [Spirosoma montaniterrae]
MSVQEIEVAITKLSSAEIQELSNWIEEYRRQQWEQRLEQDLDAGHFDELIAELTEEYKLGRTKPL